MRYTHWRFVVMYIEYELHDTDRLVRYGACPHRLFVGGWGRVLTYITGGLAYGEVKINGTNTVSAPPQSALSNLGCSCSFTFSQAQAFDHSQVNTGWVVGFGTEGKLLIPGWTYKIESLY